MKDEFSILEQSFGNAGNGQGGCGGGGAASAEESIGGGLPPDAKLVEPHSSEERQAMDALHAAILRGDSYRLRPLPFSADLKVEEVGLFKPAKDITTYELALLTQFFVTALDGSQCRSWFDPGSYARWLRERGLDRHFKREENKPSG